MVLRQPQRKAGRTASPDGDRPTARRPDFARDDVSVVLAGLLVYGIAVDGWAHQYRAELETFFTPWHGLLYTALLANIVWYARLVRTLPGRGSLWQSLPVGYDRGLLGVGAFAGGGVADMVWHTVRGVEESTRALTSPPHLVMYCAVVMIATAPLWHLASIPREERSPSATAAGLGSISVTMLITGFFFMYLSPLRSFMGRAPTVAFYERTIGGDPDLVVELLEHRGIASMLFTTSLIQVGILTAAWTGLLGRRFALWVLFTPFAFGMVTLGDFKLAGPVLLASAAAIGVTIALNETFPRFGWGRWEPVVFLPLFWLGFLAAVAAIDGLTWDFEIWGGVVFWSVLICTASARASHALQRRIPVSS